MAPPSRPDKSDTVFTKDFRHIVLNPSERMKMLVQSGKALSIVPNVPIARYQNSLNEMYRLAQQYSAEGDIEKAFVLYVRFGSMVLEEIPKHKDFEDFPISEKNLLNARCREGFRIADGFKTRLKKRYEEEAIRWAEKLDEQNRNLSADRNSLQLEHEFVRPSSQKTPIVKIEPSDVGPTQQDLPQIRDPGVFTAGIAFPQSASPLPSTLPSSVPLADVESCHHQNVNLYPAVSLFTKEEPMEETAEQSTETVCVPKDLISRFLQYAQSNTDADLEFCGFLSGHKIRERYIVTHLLIPKQEGTANSCNTFDEHKLTEFQEAHSLTTIGWIHTHPSQTAFLSSVDLHTQFMYQRLASQALAIVCAPKHQQMGVFTLTADGLTRLSECKLNGFHPHENADAMYMEAGHVAFSDLIRISVVDLRSS